MKQTNEKIIAAAEERGWINENEILLLKRRRNRGERIQIENPIPVSYDQAQKGFAWLWDKYRTPRGAEGRRAQEQPLFEFGGEGVGVGKDARGPVHLQRLLRNRKQLA